MSYRLEDIIYCSLQSGDINVRWTYFVA